MEISRLYLSLALAGLMMAFSHPVLAQVGLSTEADQIKMATRYFENQDYNKAMPVFSQIVSNNPENPFYNYCLGVCILKVDGDKADAVRFLTTATNSAGAVKIPLNAWYYLGVALHRAYRYEEAIATLQTYQKGCGKNAWIESDGEKIIAMCRNAINSKNDLSLPRHSIVNEMEITRNEFHLAYKNISGVGRFLKMPAEYEHKSLRGKPEGSLVFLNARGNTLVYTGVTKNSQTGLDIFRVVKDQSGKWSVPEPVSTSINTENDEAFPVLTDDDRTLYFSSRGVKSTGGYDVFKSEFDPVTGSWSEPVSMGSPVNSPGDDFYYVPSADGRSAYFSSDRESPSGKCNVYSATVIKDERKFVAINGVFYCPAGLDMSDAKVTILNKHDRSLMAQFRTAAKDGDYSLKLPVPSELIYRVKLDGFNDLETEVDLSNIQVPMIFQEIVVKRISGKEESVTVTNRLPETSQAVALKKAGPAGIIPGKEIMNPIPDVKKASEPAVTQATGGETAHADPKPSKGVTPSAGTQQEAQHHVESAVPNPRSTDTAARMQEPASADKENNNISQARISETGNEAGNHQSRKHDETPDRPVRSGNNITIADPSPTAVTATGNKAMEKPVLTPEPGVTAISLQSAEPATAPEKTTSASPENALISIVQKKVEEPGEVGATHGKTGIANEDSSGPATEKPVTGSNVIDATTAEKDSEHPADPSTIVAGNQTTPAEKRDQDPVKSESALQPAGNVSGENTIAGPVTPVMPTAETPVAVSTATANPVSVNDASTAPVARETANEKPVEKKKSKPGKKSLSKPVEDMPAPNITISYPEESLQVTQTRADSVIQNVVFRVQLGVYRNRTEKQLREKYATSGITELEFIRNDKGLLSVVSGNTPDYAEAVVLKEQVKSKGIADAFIVAFSDGKRHPVNMFVTAETVTVEEE